MSLMTLEFIGLFVTLQDAMKQTQSLSQTQTPEPGDIDLVSTWLRLDLPRLIAGVLAGVFAGIVMVAFAGVLCKMAGWELLLPLKVPALAVLGNEATELGMNPKALIVGFVVHSMVTGLLGGVYAHFTQTNKLLPLLGAGFVWGTFSWIFIFNLFTKSFLEVRTLDLPAGPAFFVHLVFGFSLASISYFDQIVCGRVRD